MPRKRSILLAFALCAAVIGGIPAVVAAEEPPAEDLPQLADFDARTRKDLVEAAREYLNPDLTSVYFPRKAFVAALKALQETKGIDALKNLDFMRQIMASGRGFRPDFNDRDWKRANSITEFKKKGDYRNVKSERLRFTYVQPKKYPSPSKMKGIPRPAPHPLLLALHEQEDTYNSKGDAEAYPGQAVLSRRFPKKAFSDLYDHWLMLAPVVARAKWLESNGAIRHSYSTKVLNRFWQHYHVDFDRIVLDGTSGAAALAAVYPSVFAGLVLRGGKPKPQVVKNFASVPVFVAGDAKLEKALKDAGHPDVTTGDDKALTAWLKERKRKPVSSFDWEVQLPDHVFANWIQVIGADFTSNGDGDGEGEGLNPTMQVRVVDTEAEPNTIKIDTRGIEQVSFWLSDAIVDLDRDVNLVLNGEKSELGTLERSFNTFFQKPAEIRKSMLYGWQFPVFVGPFRMPEPTEAPTEEEAPVEEEKGSAADEAKAKRFWDMAVEAEGEGNAAKAKALFGKIVEMDGPNSYKAKAQAKLDG